MSDDFAAALAARANRATNSLHSVVYFAPEAEQEFTAIGLRPGSMPYFASRSAPMGPVSAGVTAATFYNFNPAMVARHIPRAWTLASPADILAARLRVADRVLRRLLGEAIASPEVVELGELAREASTALTPEGRALYAGHADLPWPDEPHLAMWHAVTLLREHRGDGHIAALVAAGLSGVEAIATHVATGRGMLVDTAKRLRGWSDEQWSAAHAALAERGLMAGDALTDAGAALREHIEAETDRMAAAGWRHLGEQRTLRLIEVGKSLTSRAVAAGAFPPGIFTASH
jgi:hypothetical protein